MARSFFQSKRGENWIFSWLLLSLMRRFVFKLWAMQVSLCQRGNNCTIDAFSSLTYSADLTFFNSRRENLSLFLLPSAAPPKSPIEFAEKNQQKNKWETEQTRERSVKAHHKKAKNRSGSRKTVKSSLPPPPPMSSNCKMFFNYSLNALQLQQCCTCEKACSIQSGVNFSYLLEPRHVSLAHCHFQLWWEFEITLCHVIILCLSERIEESQNWISVRREREFVACARIEVFRFSSPA